MVEMRTTEGEIGVLAGHIPLTAIVEPGVVKIHQEGKVREAALLDGFVEIRGNKVTVLAEACEWPDEIDVHRAEEAKLRAERRIGSGEKHLIIFLCGVRRFGAFCHGKPSFSPVFSAIL